MLVKNHSLLFMLIGPPDPHAFPFQRFFSARLINNQRVFTHNGDMVTTEILQGGGAEPHEGIDWKQTLSVGSYHTFQSPTLLPLLLWGNGSFIQVSQDGCSPVKHFIRGVEMPAHTATTRGWAPMEACVQMHSFPCSEHLWIHVHL